MQNIWDKCQRIRLNQAIKLWSNIYKNRVNEKILSSDQIQHVLPVICCFHQPHEHVLLNSIEKSYNRLMRNCFIWLGHKENFRTQQVPKRMVFLHNQQELKFFYQQRCEYLEVLHIFSQIDQIKWQGIKHLRQRVKVEYHKVQKSDGKRMITFIAKQIEQKSYTQFPSFEQISVQQSQRINKQRFWMFSVFNGINFRKSYQQFMQFLKYFIDNELESQKQKLLELYKQCEQLSGFHDPIKYLGLYASQWGLYRFINMCLRSWSDSKDLGHIRFPFLQIFIAIKMLQNQQKHDFIHQLKPEIKQDQIVICYRGSGLKIEQLLKMRKGNRIQMTGFLSTSRSQYIAKQFLNSDAEIKVLFIIKMPQMERSFNIFHSFCQVKWPISVYSEDQVLVTPLNTFEVDKVAILAQHQKLIQQYQDYSSDKLRFNQQNINEMLVQQSNNQYSIVYLNYIDCQSQSKLLKSKHHLQESQKQFIDNYKHQKDVFLVTRNQGELLRRLNHIQDALSYYIHQFKVFLSMEKQNIQKQNHVYFFQADKYLKQLIHPATVKRLYTQLKQILHKFEWFEDKDQNLTLIKNFICNHPYRNYRLFFYMGRVYNGILFYERGQIFFQLCFLYMLFLYNRKAAGVYIAASNYSFNLERLDIYDLSHHFLERTFKFANANKIRVGFYNFSFLAMHLINCQQTSTNQKIHNYIKITKQVMLRDQRVNEDHAWIKFIDNLGNINQISKFKQYHKTNLGSSPIFLIFVCVYELKMSLLRNQIYHFGDDRDQQQITVLMDELKVAKKCLDSFGKQQLKQISTLTKVLSQSVLLYQSDMDVQCFVDEWPDANQFGQDFTYYIFRTHVEALRYLFKLCRNVKKIPIKKCIRQLQTAIKLSRKFANNSYLNMMILLSLCEFCLACYAITGHPGYRNLCVPFLKLLVESRRRLRYIKQLDRLQTELMKVKVLAAFKKMGKKFKLTISETKTLTVSYASKLTITQPQ